MNLSESVKYVLRKKGQNILSDYWREDLKLVLTDFKNDLRHSSSKKKDAGIFEGIQDLKVSVVGSLQILADLPSRIKKGFSYFTEDFLRELDAIEDPKEKKVFCLKVIGALTSFTITMVYGIKRRHHHLQIPGLKKTNVFTQYLISELLLRMTQLFIVRFLSEVEKFLDDPEEVKKIKFFKTMLFEPTKEMIREGDLDYDDRAIQIVESLKNYIMTGLKR